MRPMSPSHAGAVQVHKGKLAAKSPKYAKALELSVGEPPVLVGASGDYDYLEGFKNTGKPAEDFSFKIQPSEEQKKAMALARKQELGEYNLRDVALDVIGSDLLLINDVPVLGGAVSSIAVQTDVDTFVGETLRSSSPVI